MPDATTSRNDTRSPDAADTRTQTPAVVTTHALDVATNNLPNPLSSFIGREREIAEVKRLLSESRFVTLTGAGGSGKTRLAIQVARVVIDKFEEGVWWIELAPLADETLVPQAIAKPLDIQEIPEQPMTETLANFLRAKELLLVIDNCEHLVTACAELAEHLLNACPDLKILTTSREPFAISGETLYPISTLSLPEPSESLPARLLHSEAVRLFVERARATKPDFALTEKNAKAVAQICRRLDGIPLAIELAAARVKLLTIEHIAARLDDRFDLLTTGNRTALPRQQTLRATIDWSYDLLPEEARVLFRRLAVFAGGFTLEAAEQICSGEPLLPHAVLDHLASLVDRSLVIVDQQHETERYGMLETIREYAFEKLREASEIDLLRTRHLDFFVSFAEQAEPELKRAQQLERLERLDTELDNFRAALNWSLNQGRVEQGLRLAGALLRFWDMRGYWSEGLEWVERLLIQPEAASRTLARANALLTGAELAGSLGERSRAIQYLEELIGIAREVGALGKRTLALGLGSLGERMFIDHPVAAESLVDEGLTIARATGDEWLIASLLYHRGFLFTGSKENEKARELLEESLALFQSLGDMHGVAVATFHVTRMYFRQGDLARARRMRQEILPLLRQAKDRRYIWYMLLSLGEMARAEGNYDLAKRYYDEVLVLARELGGKFQISTATLTVGFVALYEGKIDAARALFVESLELASDVDYGGTLAGALTGFAGVAAAEKDARRAVQILSVVEPLLHTGDTRTLSPADEAEYRRHLAIARKQLDDAAFSAAWEEGRNMTTEQAIEYALEKTAAGERTVQPQITRQQAKEKIGGLTEREREVAARIAQGESNREIAQALVVSERTVESHVTNILNKLGFTSRAEIRKWAVEKGLGKRAE